jgi:hypothetical protein
MGLNPDIPKILLYILRSAPPNPLNIPGHIRCRQDTSHGSLEAAGPRFSIMCRYRNITGCYFWSFSAIRR